MPIGELNLQEANVPLLLSRIAYKYEVPIGVEVSPKDDLLKGSKVTIQMSGGTLRDALNSLVRQYPLYTWSLTDGVINVFPRDESRDPLLKTLLETSLQDFSIKRGELRFNLRESITSRPELQRLVRAHRVRAENETFIARDHRTIGRDFSLEVSDLTVKAILNRVIKESQTKYWIVNRYGTKRQYLLLNL